MLERGVRSDARPFLITASIERYHEKNKPMHCFCIGFLYLCSRLIQKVMAKNLLNKYVWLVETINKAKKITFEEINENILVLTVMC